MAELLAGSENLKPENEEENLVFYGPHNLLEGETDFWHGIDDFDTLL